MADTDKITRKMTLLNKYGMHVRPAGLFAKTASRYDADIEVEKDGNVVSGKSIMALMTLEAVSGTVLTVTATGPQAADADAHRPGDGARFCRRTGVHMQGRSRSPRARVCR